MRYLWILLVISSCYSFKGISIDPDIHSFSIPNIEDQSSNAPATYAVDFSVALTNKIRRETRLIQNNTKPDLKFICKITQFNVVAIAPIEGRTNALNRLTIAVEVDCINTVNEKNSWKASFSRFEDFDAQKNLSEVQSVLLENVNKLLLEDIFNKAFSNW